MKKHILSLFALLFSISAFAQLDLIQKAAENGDIDAQNYLGEIYFDGKDGVKKNVQESYKWYLKAAQSGDRKAQYKIAMFKNNLNGRWDSNEEIQEMIHWLTNSADNGYAPAQEHLAFFMRNMGKSTEAFQAYSAAANQAYPPAFLGMAECYFYGIGISIDYQLAANWYSKAVVEGIALDTTVPMLGFCYCKLGDYDKAKSCYEAGIKADYPSAYNNMAYLYAEGKGVTKDMKEAYRLINIALEKLPNNPELLDSKGDFFLSDNKTTEAAEIWTIINRIDSEFAQTSESHFCTTMRSYMNGSVDTNIAETKQVNKNTYVVIIANENYKREEKVPFAHNDGSVFQNYCRKMLGVPEANLKYIADATYNDIKYCINWLKQITIADNGQARLIFYYAGHGIPDEAQETAYLLPIDGYGTDTTTGYSLTDLYNALSKLSAQSITVFLDACFSGSKRDGGMLNPARGIVIKVKETTPLGNIVVLSAAQKNETAYPYKEQQHGMFTYYLLKKMQETEGETTLGELCDYVINQVRKQSILMNDRMQTPTVNSSVALGNTWKEWKFK